MGKKLVRYAMIACILFVSASCAANKQNSVAERSWACYCERYGVNPDAPTVEQENYYLDCYAGSVLEEKDLNL